MSKMSPTELLDAFKDMTTLELADFVRGFETTFGVTAAPPVHIPAPTPTDHEPEPEPAQTIFTVTLAAVGDKKVQVIKEVRAIVNLGLKDAKDLVDTVTLAGTPARVLIDVPREQAERARARLTAVGATVEVT